MNSILNFIIAHQTVIAASAGLIIQEIIVLIPALGGNTLIQSILSMLGKIGGSSTPKA